MSDSEGIDLQCPHCQQRLRVPSTTAGTQIQCPDCARTIEVPAKTGISGEPRRDWSWPTGEDSDRDDEPRRRSRDREDYDDDFESARRSRRSSRSSSRSGDALAPAICMLIVAILGVFLNFIGVVLAFVDDGKEVDRNLPPVLQELMKRQQGPLSAAVQGFLGLLSLIEIAGSVQMIRRKTWWLGIVSCVLSIINYGNCCCLFGLPFGIWGLITLLRSDVKDGFS